MLQPLTGSYSSGQSVLTQWGYSQYLKPGAVSVQVYQDILGQGPPTGWTFLTLLRVYVNSASFFIGASLIPRGLTTDELSNTIAGKRLLACLPQGGYKRKNQVVACLERFCSSPLSVFSQPPRYRCSSSSARVSSIAWVCVCDCLWLRCKKRRDPKRKPLLNFLPTS